MKIEINNWWKQAQSDLKKAEVLYHSKDYDGVAFYSQQAVEKGLKALYIFSFGKNPPKVHDLTLLCDQLGGIPESIRLIAEKLTPSYIFARYPDASSKIPAELYSNGQAKSFLNLAKEALEWIKKNFK